MPAFMKLTQVYLNIAKEIASLSNCVSYQVGAIAVKDGRILATGYNGTPKGYKNCSHQFPSYSFSYLGQSVFIFTLEHWFAGRFRKLLLI